MPESKHDRAAYFPAIEKKHGQPMSYWFEQMEGIKDLKYPEQIAYLRENHGFSQAHANALVLYSRGNTTSRRYDTLQDYLATLDPVRAGTIERIFAAIQRAYPDLELVIAWNQPMLKHGKTYVFGASAQTRHILLAPWSQQVLEDFRPRLAGYTVNKKTFQVPADWKVDVKLLRDLVGAVLADEP